MSNNKPTSAPEKKSAPAPAPENKPVPILNINTLLPSVEIQCNVPTTDVSSDVIGAAIIRLLKAGNMNPTSEDISNTIVAILNNN